MIMDAEAGKAVAIQQKKVARAELKKMIRLSQWGELKVLYPDFTPNLIEYRGKTYFDWTSMTPEMSLLFTGETILKNPPFSKKEKGLKGTYKAVTVPLVIVEKGIPLRILECIGDRIVGFASAIIGFEKFKTDRRGYHNLAQGLISNANLETAGYQTGDAAEIELGCVLVAEGPQAAIEAAIKLLKKTAVYRQVVK